MPPGVQPTSEAAFVIAAGITALVCVLVVVYLRGPLLRALCEVCGTEPRARFWAAYSNVVLLLVPLVAVMLARLAPPADSLLFTVVGYLQWSLVALVVSLFVIGVGATFIGPAEPVVTRGQIDDLQRLVAKIEEMRAHEIVRRSAAERGAQVAAVRPAAPGRAVPPGDAPLSEAPPSRA
jgi:hypothetical protein